MKNFQTGFRYSFGVGRGGCGLDFTRNDEWKMACDQYGWQPVRVEGDGRVFKVTLPDRELGLKRSGASYEKLMLLHRILEKMNHQGFGHTLPWELTPEGEPVVRTRTSCWYAVPWKEKGADEVSAQDVVMGLAHLHRFSEPVLKDYPELAGKTDERLIDEWEEKRRDLKSYQEQIRAREFPSPFDQSAEQIFKQLDQSLSFAIRGMKRYLESEDGAPPRYALCHIRIHPGNIVADQENFYFIDFDHAGVDSPVRDLALAVERLSDPSDPKNSPSALIQAYEEICPLRSKEKKLLGLYLSYPERLLKTLRIYYHDPKLLNDEPEAVSRLEKEMARYEKNKVLVRRLWTNRKKGKANKEIRR
jgi:thiamine kinase-like enzyme